MTNLSPSRRSAISHPSSISSIASWGEAKTKIGEYQDETSKLVTSEKFLSYRLHRFETLLNSLPIGVVLVDEETIITLVNSRTKTLLGLEPDELIGSRPSVAFRHPLLARTLFRP